jgi:hypothetical protein
VASPRATASASAVEKALRRLPRRLDRIGGALETGRLSVNVRVLADAADRRYFTGMLHQVIFTALAATAGIMAVLMLGLHGGGSGPLAGSPPTAWSTPFAVNHLAPFLLTGLLLDRLTASAPTRIVTVSSAAHATGTTNFGDLEGERRYSGQQAYSQSELAGIGPYHHPRFPAAVCIKGDRKGLPGRASAGSPPHPQGAQEKGAEEDGNADEQQVQHAFRDNAHDTQHHRRDHQQQKQGDHPILRSGGRLSSGPAGVRQAGTFARTNVTASRTTTRATTAPIPVCAGWLVAHIAVSRLVSVGREDSGRQVSRSSRAPHRAIDYRD